MEQMSTYNVRNMCTNKMKKKIENRIYTAREIKKFPLFFYQTSYIPSDSYETQSMRGKRGRKLKGSNVVDSQSLSKMSASRTDIEDDDLDNQKVGESFVKIVKRSFSPQLRQ